ncbi:hypothetical protein PMAYCL1PPCAC_20862, partial [Pristionchus mayeri]
IMVYVPRTRTRAPVLSRLRESMHRLLDDAISAQAQATVYTRSSVYLNQLVDSVNFMMEEDGNTGLNFFQKDTVKIAQKIAQLFENLQGVRLRAFEEMGIPMDDDESTKEEPLPTYPGTSSDLDIKEDPDLIKEEPICDVDTTPMPYPGTAQPVMNSILERGEIKTEEPDDEPTPSTSATVLATTGQSILRLEPPRLQPMQQMRKPVVKVIDGGKIRAVAITTGTPPIRKIIRRPSPYAKPTSSRSYMRTPVAQYAGSSQSAYNSAGSSTSSTPLGAQMRMAAKTAVYRHTQISTRIKESAFNDGKLFVMCKYCKTSMDERKLASHIAEVHQVTPLSKSVQLDYRNFILQ